MSETTIATTGRTFTINRLPLNKPVQVKTAIRDERMTLLITDRGVIYSANLMGARYFSERSGISVRAVKLLASLGVITKDQAEEHERRVAAINAADQAQWRLDSLRDTAEKYGIKIARRELAKIERVANADKGKA